MNKEERTRESLIRKIQRDTKHTHYHLVKGGYYYRHGCRGYVSHRIEAGIFSKDETLSHLSCTAYLHAVPVDKSQHNKMILDEIKRLTSYIID